MKFLSRLFIIVAAFSLLTTGTLRAQDASGFPRTITDGAGNKVTINAKPEHIVSATLGTDEMLFALVDPARLTAITGDALNPDESNIVEQAKQIKNHLTTADPEVIVSYHPDLVFVASYTDAGVIKQLRDAGLTVFLLGNFSSIKDIENNIMLVGQAVGADTQATKLVDDMETRLKAIADAVKDEKPQTVLYYGPEKSSDGPCSTVDDVIAHAGGVNIVTAAGIKDPYPQVSDEFIVKQDPDFILLAGYNSYSPGFVDSFNKNPNFQTLKAVKNKHVVIANDAHVVAVSQYIVDGVSDIAALLYPDAYQPAATMTATEVATAAP
jgi:iron complex transport system substrate-binding protein